MTPILAADTDWGIVINTITLCIITVAGAWFKFKLDYAAQERMRAAEDIKDIKKIARKTAIHVNGQSLASKRIIAIAADNLAISSGSEEHKKLAKEAWEDYETQVVTHRNAEIADHADDKN